MKKLCDILSGWLVLLMLTSAAHADGPPLSSDRMPGEPLSREYKLKAAYLFNLTRFAEWPQRSFTDPQSPVQICVLVNNDNAQDQPVSAEPFLAFLTELVRGRRVGAKQRSIEVKQIASGARQESACHLLYPLCLDCNYQAPSYTLTVGDQGAGYATPLITFYPDNNRIRLEVSVSRLRDSGIKISSELLKLARKAK